MAMLKTRTSTHLARVPRRITVKKLRRRKYNTILHRFLLEIFGSLSPVKIPTEDMVFRLQGTLMRSSRSFATLLRVVVELALYRSTFIILY